MNMNNHFWMLIWTKSNLGFIAWNQFILCIIRINYVCRYCLINFTSDRSRINGCTMIIIIDINYISRLIVSTVCYDCHLIMALDKVCVLYCFSLFIDLGKIWSVASYLRTSNRLPRQALSIIWIPSNFTSN